MTANGTGKDITILLARRSDCAADVNGSLDVLDFVTLQSLRQDEALVADCDDNGTFSMLDVICFPLVFSAAASDQDPPGFFLTYTYRV